MYNENEDEEVGSEISLHAGQSEIFEDLFVNQSVRNAVAVCCRGWGKSHLGAAAAINAVFELQELPKWVPNKNVYIIAPTYDQVADIYYPLLVYQLGMEHYCTDHSKDKGRLWFPNDVQLRLVSYEAIERLRGKGAYFVVNDEVRDWTKGSGFKDAWESIIQPCITTRWSPKHAARFGAKSAGRSLTISTPKGYDYLYDMSNFQDGDSEWKTYKFDHTKAPLLDPTEVEKARHSVDPIKFAREYKASFEESGNTVFYCFDRKVHVRKDLEWFTQGSALEPGEDVHVGIDFNVGLQCSSAFAIRGKEIHYLTTFKGSPDTETLAVSIKAKFWPNFNVENHPDYKKKPCKIYVYPDPTGKSRKTSATIGITDFSILAAHGFIVQSRTGSPPIVDSVAAVNRLLKNAAGEVSMYFAADCKELIASMERTAWVEKNPDTATIDKTNGDEHFSDGVRYPMEFLYPVGKGKVTVAKGGTF